jgi:hypothetical protein
MANPGMLRSFVERMILTAGGSQSTWRNEISAADLPPAGDTSFACPISALRATRAWLHTANARTPKPNVMRKMIESRTRGMFAVGLYRLSSGSSYATLSMYIPRH